MTPETERIPVPTNGKRPQPLPESPAVAAPTAEGAEPISTTAAFTPTQLAVGFGILASLLVLGAGWLRRRSRRGPGGLLGRR